MSIAAGTQATWTGLISSAWRASRYDAHARFRGRRRNCSTCFTPGAVLLVLVVLEGLDQTIEHFRRGFEHDLHLRVIDLFDVLTHMGADLAQTLLHFLSVMDWISFVSGHGRLRGLS